MRVVAIPSAHYRQRAASVGFTDCSAGDSLANRSAFCSLLAGSLAGIVGFRCHFAACHNPIEFG